MRRILGTVVLLLILVTALGGCQDRRKDVIPTKFEPLEKAEPQPVGEPEPF